MSIPKLFCSHSPIQGYGLRKTWLESMREGTDKFTLLLPAIVSLIHQELKDVEHKIFTTSDALIVQVPTNECRINRKDVEGYFDSKKELTNFVLGKMDPLREKK